MELALKSGRDPSTARAGALRAERRKKPARSGRDDNKERPSAGKSRRAPVGMTVWNSDWGAEGQPSPGRLGQDFVSEAAVGDGAGQLLCIHAVGEAWFDLAGVVEGLYLVWGELQVQTG